jgi:thymidylate synthase
MKVLNSGHNVVSMLAMYRMVLSGTEIHARGTTSRNVRNLCIVLNPQDSCLTSFDDRKLNLDYCKKEWLWYLRADKYDDSIEKYASMWAKIKQPDGAYYSNYGQYLFAPGPVESGASQFEYCVHTLRKDPDSRRASIVLLQRNHLFPDNSDVVCTYAIHFCIELGRLYMTVHMRSNDVVFGFTNDSFCFWQLYRFMFVLLKLKYPDLKFGTYTHTANSMHVYDRHYEMLTKIDSAGLAGHTDVDVPMPTANEVAVLIRSRGEDGEGAYSDWLKA